MSVELGKYAFAVLASYGVSLGLLAVLVVASVMRARKAKKTLEQIENRVKKHG